MNDGILQSLRDVDHDLSSLVDASRRILSRAGLVAGDGRVTAWPDARTIRYYQSVGLVSKPLRYEGRQAVYGYQHLLQAVAVKLLQARGLSLAQVQRALSAASREQLESALRDALGGTMVAHESPSDVPPPPGVQAARPEPSAADGPAIGSPSTLRPLLSAELMPGVHVCIDPARVTEPETLLRRLARACRSDAENEQEGVQA